MVRKKILIVDDDIELQNIYIKLLTKAGYDVVAKTTISEGQKALFEQNFQAILLDLMLPDGNGIDWIIDLKENYPAMAIIIITGHADIPLAVEAMRRGADHFLTKPVNFNELEVSLQKCIEINNLRRKDIIEKRTTKVDQIFFGENEKMKQVYELATLAAQNDSPVILEGETGTGKGMLAKWIHQQSNRKDFAFIEINCSSLKGDLLASELFGHARGAFTSAVQDRQGLLEVADGGTLFLDEIGDMDLGVQAQFLKVIEEKQFRRLGEVKLRRSEFRTICATNQNLIQKIKEGSFRKDLYYRINVLTIHLPPLRERLDDFEKLVFFLLENITNGSKIKLSPHLIDFLKSYHWPGNIRELRNVLERAILLSRGNPLTKEHFPGLDKTAFSQDLTNEFTNLKKLEELHINQALHKYNGNIEKAAKELGLSRATLYRKIKKHNIKIPKSSTNA
jgi:DNA-binding NtrC family response regulator